MDLDGLTQKLLQGSKTALKMVETLVTTPMLINTDIRQGAQYAIPLMCETNQKSASAEVSESLIISTDAKKNISDNVAPGSKSWNLSGYIPGLREAEPINKFQPFVQFHTDVLWSWFDHGAVLVYKDGSAEVHKRVVIKQLQTAQQKDSANATPFTMTLKEINVMEMDLTQLAEDITTAVNQAKNSVSAIGSKFGSALSMGSTTSTAGGLTGKVGSLFSRA
jgi:hypothetical protein